MSADKPVKSSPSLDEVDSAWSDNEEGLDEDATMVGKVPLDLVALSRRGHELENKIEEPEKHEAITARPPPLAAGEASVVVDAPHEDLPKKPPKPEELDEAELEEDAEEPEEEELAADDLDAGWDVEEERAAAADVAAGLSAEARKLAAEARAAQRKDKSRAKKLAAKEKRRARADAIKQKQKKPKKRSTPPPREAGQGTARSNPPPAKRDSEPPTSRARRTLPPKQPRFNAAAMAARRDLNRMILFVALVVVVGALVIGLMRRS